MYRRFLFSKSIAIPHETSYNFFSRIMDRVLLRERLSIKRDIMNPKSKNSSFLSIIIAFILGLVIGLVVLGWGLWPVQWTGGTMDTLSPEVQQNYLRAAIDSYAYNQDVALAQQRYATLGDQNQQILVDITANPGNLEKTDIIAFTKAVNAPPVAVAATEPVSSSASVTPQPKSVMISMLSVMQNRSTLMNVCLPVGMLIVVVLVILMVFLSRRNKKSSKTGEQAIEPSATEAAGMITEIPPQGQAVESQDAVVKTDANTGIETAIPVENELPDWLREASPEGQPVPVETNIEESAVELSDSDIKDITSSKFSTLESEPAPSPDNGITDQTLTSSSAFVPDGSDRPVTLVTEPAKPVPQPEAVVTAAPFQETQQETFAKFSREIELTPGIDPEHAKKLRSLGITAPLLLLKKGASPQGRQTIASGVGVPEMQVLKWVNEIDLLRIKGLTIPDAQMLNAAGVNMLVELATRDPESLLEKLETASHTDDPSYKIPSLAQVQNWITQARELPRIISYS
jgi:hypothetical protein